VACSASSNAAANETRLGQVAAALAKREREGRVKGNLSGEPISHLNLLISIDI